MCLQGDSWEMPRLTFWHPHRWQGFRIHSAGPETLLS
jgi:hypothetical protein